MTDLSLLTALLSLSLHVGAQTTSCNYRPLRGIAKDGLWLSSFVARSGIDCMRLSCGCQPACAASFNPTSKQCWKVLFCNILDPHQFVLVNGSDAWVTFVLIEPSESPNTLWLLDDVDKGRNLGKKGAQLNMSIEGLVWDTVGPRGAVSARKYSRYIGLINEIPTIQVLHEGSYALRFTVPHTVTFWVKTDNVADTRFLLEGSPNGAVDIWFYPSKQRDQIHVALKPKHRYITIRNTTGIDQWRHIAFVYRAVEDATFYLNGSIWQHTVTKVSFVKKTEKFCLFRHCTNDLKTFYGSMACLAMFDKALAQKEVEFVMKACP